MVRKSIEISKKNRIVEIENYKEKIEMLFMIII